MRLGPRYLFSHHIFDFILECILGAKAITCRGDILPSTTSSGIFPLQPEGFDILAGEARAGHFLQRFSIVKSRTVI